MRKAAAQVGLPTWHLLNRPQNALLSCNVAHVMPRADTAATHPALHLWPSARMQYQSVNGKDERVADRNYHNNCIPEAVETSLHKLIEGRLHLGRGNSQTRRLLGPLQYLNHFPSSLCPQVPVATAPVTP